VACQRQHWTSHKRQCRELADAELQSIFSRMKHNRMIRVLGNPSPSEAHVLPKLSAITWTIRPECSDLHMVSRPAPGDTKETLVRLLKRAAAELPWWEIAGQYEGNFHEILDITRLEHDCGIW
jgi:hypothetical protein